MKNRFCTLIATGALLCAFGAMEAKAATVLVFEDDLNYSFTLTVTSPGHATLSFSSVTLADVNSGAGPQAAAALPSSMANLSFTYTGPTVASAPFFTSVSGSSTKTIGPTAVLNYNVTVGGGKSLTSDGFLNLKGAVTGLGAGYSDITSNGNTFSWSPFATGGTVNMTFTSGSNIAALLAAGSGTATGVGGIQEQAVPEPASLALLGIGMTGFLAFRRFFKKTSVA